MAAGLGDAAKSVQCDSSATVTIVTKDGAKVSKGGILKIFASSSNKAAKKWKPANFRRESRAPAVVQYVVSFSGST